MLLATAAALASVAVPVTHYQSTVQSVAPQVAGLQVQALEPAGHLRLVDRTGRTVVIYGYESEPFAQVLADGTVQLNDSSPTVYLNRRPYGGVRLPPGVGPTVAPRWRVVAHGGTLDWDDRRAHWTSPGLPPQVTDRSRTTPIFAWTIPIAVGTQHGAIYGRLRWVPTATTSSRRAHGGSLGGGGVAAIVIGVLVVVGLGGLAVTGWRRRRR